MLSVSFLVSALVQSRLKWPRALTAAAEVTIVTISIHIPQWSSLQSTRALAVHVQWEFACKF